MRSRVPQKSEKPPELNCNSFADLVQSIADKAYGKHDFLDELAKTFTGARNSSWREMLYNSAGPSKVRTSDEGFKSEFREFQNGVAIDTHNQARHYIGGFITAARLGETLGRRFMNDQEVRGRADYDSDVALTRFSTAHADVYFNSGHGIDFTRRYLARAIRIQVCGNRR